MVIMDLKDKRSESEDASSSSSGGGGGSDAGSSHSQSPTATQKSCSDCHTTRTPLWRGGPAGPKTLCNACGIKYNKKRRELLGLDTRRKDRNKKKKNHNNGGSGNKNSGEVGQSLKLNLMALGWQRSGKPRSSKLGEEEQAAILLMALSCGSVYA